MDIYKQIHISNSDKFYLYTGVKEEDKYTFDFNKEHYEFLMDAYNSNLEDSRQKFAQQLSAQSYDSMLFAKRMEMDYHLISFDEAYETLGAFMRISDEDYSFIKSFMFLMTSDEFLSDKVVEQLNRLFDENPVRLDLDYRDTTMNESSQRLGLISYMIQIKWAVYDNCFSKTICDCVNVLRKYDLDDKLAFDAHIETNNSVFNRSFGHTFNTMMDALLFEIYCFINNNITIKQCKNCGKLFQPLRADALYCDNISPQEETKTCKEYGAYQQWITNIKSDEATSLYRKIYMRKQMQAKRNPDIDTYIEDFENYKQNTKQWKADTKSGKKTNEEFLAWLENLK